MNHHLMHSHPHTTPVWRETDGGRAAAGFTGRNPVGDCVARAIAIAGDLDYGWVYRTLAKRAAQQGLPRSARSGMPKRIYASLLADLGWTWTPTMAIGQGTTVHLRADELPPGRLAVEVSKHMTAVIDGVIHDTYDPSRDGTRCVYGYWTVPDLTV